MKSYKKFNAGEWLTPNCYNNNYCLPTKRPGVYIFAVPTVDCVNIKVDYEILYVGSSNNIHRRFNGHEIKRYLQDHYEVINFYFQEVENYREVEKVLIKALQPKYNKQGLS